MAQVIKNLKVDWTWNGDTYALKGFNVAITPSGESPNTKTVITAKVPNNVATYTFQNLILDSTVTYTAWVQALYEGGDSDWLSTGNATVSDDGNATIAVKKYVDQSIWTTNTNFYSWTGSYPTGFAQWGSYPAPTKDTVNTKSGGSSVRFNVAGSGDQHGISISNSAFISNVPNEQYLYVEVDFMLISGSIGGAGLLVDWTGLTPYRASIKLSDFVPSPNLGKWHTVRTVIERPSGTTGTFTSMNGYIMGNYSGLGTGTVKNIAYDRLMIRQATQQEIDLYANKSTWNNVATNFNTRNDRNSTIPASPALATDGTCIDHVLNANGSADISFEWTYTGSGDEYNVDGFKVYVYCSTSSSAYTFGTTPSSEQVFVIPENKRAFILSGVTSNLYYTFGIQAYRAVDQDIASSGVLNSSIVKSTATGENPYQPSTNSTFTGDITGTISGTSASTVVSNASNGNSAYSNWKHTTDTTKIDGGKIYTGTITADKIVIGNFYNLVENGGFEYDSIGWTMPTGATIDSTAPHTGLKCLKIAGGGTIRDATNNTNYIEVKEGEQYYLEGWYKADSGTNGTAHACAIFVYDKNKTITQYVGLGSTTNATTTWTKATATYTIPAGACYIKPWLSVRGDCTTGAWYFDDFVIRRMSEGNLIVDGTITANKIISGEGSVGNGNLAIGKTLSGNNDNTACIDGANVVGSTYTTFGATGTQNNNASESLYIQIDLGATYRIAESRLFFYSADSRYYWYKVKYSTDGNNWYYAVGTPSNTGWVTSAPSTSGEPKYNPTVNTFSTPISARYLRVYGNGNTMSTNNNIYEWELYSVPQTIIDGGQIKTGTVTADRLKANTITATSGVIASLDAGVITTGYLDANRINSNTIGVGKLDLDTQGKIANGDSALQQGWLTKNTTFSKWSGTYPDGFTQWSSSSIMKETSLTRNGGYGARFNVTALGQQVGMQMNSNAFISNITNYKYLMLEFDFMLLSGTLNGSAVLIDWSGMSPYRVQVNLASEVTSPTTYKWYSVRKIIKRPTDTTTGWTGMSGYVLANWSSSGDAVKEIIFDRVAVREATQQEINIYTWQHSSDTTLIDGGKIYTGSITIGNLDSSTQNMINKGDVAESNAKQYSDNNALIDGISIGGVFTGSFELNKLSDGTANPGEVKINYGTFIHPNGNEYTIPTGCLNTMVESLSSQDWRYIAFIGSDTTRFSGLGDNNFCAIKFANGVWKYDNNSTLVTFTPNQNDCIVAKVVGQTQLDSLKLYASKRVIAGSIADSVSAWRHNSNLTQIDGGKIYTGSITSNQIQTGTITVDDINSTELEKILTKTINIKANYNAFSTANNGEMYLHGYNSSGNSADVDGYIYYQGTKYTVPKGQVNSSATFDVGYIMFDPLHNLTARPTGYVITPGTGTNSKCILVVYDNGQWKYDNNTTLVAFTPLESDLIIGKVTGSTTSDYINDSFPVEPTSIGAVTPLERSKYLVKNWGHNSDTTLINGGMIYTGSITADKIMVADGSVASGNLAYGLTVSGTGGNSTIPTDGVRVAGSPYYGFGTGNQNNNSAESAYVQLDLGATYRIAENRIFFYSNDTRYYYYKLKYSTDGTNWKYAVGNSGNAGWVTSAPSTSGKPTFNPTIDRFAIPITARYLRIYANGNSANNGNHIFEWEVYSAGITEIHGGQITTNSIRADHMEVGAIQEGFGNIPSPNLLYNGRGLYGGAMWRSEGLTALWIPDQGGSAYTYCPFSGKNGFGLYKSTTGEAFLSSETIRVIPNKTYTFSCMMNKESNVSSGQVYVIGSANNDRAYTWTPCIINYTSAKQYTASFTVPSNINYIYIRIDNDGWNGQNAGQGGVVLWVTDIMLVEGDKVGDWCPHSGEVLTGSVEITGSGITIRNGDFKMYNVYGDEVMFSDDTGLICSDRGIVGYRDTGGGVMYGGGGIYNIPGGGNSPLYIESDYGIQFKNSSGGQGQGTAFREITVSGVAFDPWAWGGDNHHSYIRASCQDTFSLTLYNQWNTGFNMDFYCASAHMTNMYSSGAKNCIVETADYGTRAISAYETCEYFFGDIGSGKITDGKCIVMVEDVFKQLINTDVEYHVFLQKYGMGDVYVSERNPNYFVVEGDEGLEFSWELKAKRKGYENHRLETMDYDGHEPVSEIDENVINTLNEGDSFITSVDNDLTQINNNINNIESEVI